MDDPIDVTVDSFAEGARLGGAEPDVDEPDEVARPGVGPRYVIRENAPVIDENDPSPPRDRDELQPDPDAPMPDVEAAVQDWKATVRDAVTRWDRLTEDDALALGRHEASLTALVRERYSLSMEETLDQVTDFIKDHQSFEL